MAFEHKDGQVSIFKNTYKEAGDNKPEYKGKGIFNDQPFEISLWLKEGKDGGKFFSGTIRPPQVKAPAATTAAVPEPAEPIDDLPF